jgi:hypothetical protein
VQTRQEILNLLDGSEPHFSLEVCRQVGSDQITEYIGGKYQPTLCSQKKVTHVTCFIVMIVVDIAIYHLVSKKAPEESP